MSRTTKYRSSKTREETPLLFVMGDGESECKYFDDLNGMVKRIRIRPRELGVSGWQKIIEKCDGHVTSREVDLKHGDRLAIVTDEDGRYDSDSITLFQKECDRKGYELMLSNKSFEVWLLMHYESFTVPYTQNELENKLTEHLGKEYRKSNGIPFNISMVRFARDNSERNLPGKSNLDCFRTNPSTRLHLLIDDILDKE